MSSFYPKGGGLDLSYCLVAVLKSGVWFLLMTYPDTYYFPLPAPTTKITAVLIFSSDVCEFCLHIFGYPLIPFSLFTDRIC